MGRNFPLATELVHQVIADLEPFTESLPPQDRLVFAKFAEYVLNNRSVMANAANLLPLEATLLAVLLEEHKRTQSLYGELCAEIERLKGVAQRLEEVPLGEEVVHEPGCNAIG